jgi:hypothetical protein
VHESVAIIFQLCLCLHAFFLSVCMRLGRGKKQCPVHKPAIFSCVHALYIIYLVGMCKLYLYTNQI